MGDFFAIINAAIQIFGIVGIHSYGIAWALYPSMVLFGILIFVQTISAGILMGLFTLGKDLKRKNTDVGLSPGIGILISLLYMLSAYQIYLIGYPFFAGVAAAHAAITLILNIMKGLAK